MSGPDRDEARETQAKPRYEPCQIEVDMRLPAREVEAIMRKHFHFPESMDGQVEGVAYAVARAMSLHYLSVHMLMMHESKGTA